MTQKSPDDILARQRQLARIIASSDEGREFLDMIETFCHYGEDVHSPDARMTSYWQGRQSVAVKIRQLLKKESTSGRQPHDAGQLDNGPRDASAHENPIPPRGERKFP